ncbi:hypothetical protein PINS_up004773 [Pythium insidiosum]|nr:hypothetical protein PINS_up004773 [Pythium insidiosum]
MPCLITECSPISELQRFGVALLGLYAYHFLWDSLLIAPFADYLVRHGHMGKDKRDKFRESAWKNAAVGTFFLFGLYIGHDKDWWMNPKGYFVDWPYNAPEPLRWYYMIYLSFWLQSIDFMLNLTNKHYIVKRKDNAEMLLHHFATISLMIFSYSYDLTRIGMCVLMIHDVNDLLLETAKIFVYLNWETTANILFGIFAVVWFIVRWAFYGYNILYSVYTEAYDSIVEPILKNGSYGGYPSSVWYWFWVVFSSFLGLLLVLHIFWGVLIVKMIVRSLQVGAVEKDIRSDSEADEEDEEPVQATTTAATAPDSGKVKRRRAPKAD